MRRFIPVLCAILVVMVGLAVPASAQYDSVTDNPLSTSWGWTNYQSADWVNSVPRPVVNQPMINFGLNNVATVHTTGYTQVAQVSAPWTATLGFQGEIPDIGSNQLGFLACNYGGFAGRTPCESYNLIAHNSGNAPGGYGLETTTVADFNAQYGSVFKIESAPHGANGGIFLAVYDNGTTTQFAWSPDGDPGTFTIFDSESDGGMGVFPNVVGFGGICLSGTQDCEMDSYYWNEHPGGPSGPLTAAVTATEMVRNPDGSLSPRPAPAPDGGVLQADGATIHYPDGSIGVKGWHGRAKPRATAPTPQPIVP